MLQIRTAKLFKNGRSQAVRLPAEFRFRGDEVYVTRNEATGDVVLSDRPGTKIWGDFFDLIHSLDVPPDFMADRPMNVPCQTSGVFDDVNMLIDERKI
jgi:antitoxin VapB